jgi:aldehyde:ferredoxin oxidoreductase
MVRAITGWKVNLWELMKAGERGVTMARVFNMREGMTRVDDSLPKRFSKHHVTKTINEKPVTPEVLQEALTTFYGMMGWDPQTGKPTLAKLQELDIAWAAEHLPE